MFIDQKQLRSLLWYQTSFFHLKMCIKYTLESWKLFLQQLHFGDRVWLLHSTWVSISVKKLLLKMSFPLFSQNNHSLTHIHTAKSYISCLAKSGGKVIPLPGLRSCADNISFESVAFFKEAFTTTEISYGNIHNNNNNILNSNYRLIIN